MILSLNWEGEDLSINKKGFLLSDACAGVLIVSLCAVLVSAMIQEHTNTKQLLQQKEEEIEEELELSFKRTVPCQECIVASPSSKY